MSRRKLDNENMRRIQTTITIPTYLMHWIKTKENPGRMIESVFQKMYDEEMKGLQDQGEKPDLWAKNPPQTGLE